MSAQTLDGLRAGDLMFTTIPGIGGKLIALGEKLNDPEVTWDMARRVQHVGVVTQACPFPRTPLRGAAGPMLVQAMPGGAEEVELGEGCWTPTFLYVRPAYRDMWSLNSRPNPWDQSARAARAARSYVGVPYSDLDYAAIALRHLAARKPTDRTWFDRYVTSTKHMICSQLADQALADAGFHVFDDGRIPQDVTPAALYCKLITLPDTRYLIPTVTGWRR